MRSIPATRLLLMGMSMRRNLPPTGTAGLARSRVRGHSRLPCPPPRIAVTTFSMAASPRKRLDLTAGDGIYAYRSHSFSERPPPEGPHPLSPLPPPPNPPHRERGNPLERSCRSSPSLVSLLSVVSFLAFLPFLPGRGAGE